MPYAISFVKLVEIADPEIYINDCCIGGDVVLNRLLPAIRERYQDIQANQEDWGWFAWFGQGPMRLAVDIFTNDHNLGQFQIHLTSRRPRMVLRDKIEDGSELESLRETVLAELTAWQVSALEVERVNEKYLPA